MNINSVPVFNDILKDLQKHKRDKEFLREFFITQRLNKCLEIYKDELNKSKESLIQELPEKVLNKLGKI